MLNAITSRGHDSIQILSRLQLRQDTAAELMMLPNGSFFLDPMHRSALLCVAVRCLTSPQWNAMHMATHPYRTVPCHATCNAGCSTLWIHCWRTLGSPVRWDGDTRPIVPTQSFSKPPMSYCVKWQTLQCKPEKCHGCWMKESMQVFAYSTVSRLINARCCAYATSTTSFYLSVRLSVTLMDCGDRHKTG